jgi:hypothetical protein
LAKGKKTGGRKKGTPNKLTGDLKELILQALADSGGVMYLKARAADNPTAFLTLVGKVLPLQVTGKDGKDLEAPHTIVNNYVVAPPAVDAPAR